MKRNNQKKLPYKILKINADTLTPVNIFKQLKGKKRFLLESSFEHEKKGKYSYIGSDPYQEIIGHENLTTVIHHESLKTEQHNQNALDYIREQFPKFEIDIPLPFIGGAIGFIGYDAIQPFEDIGTELPDDLQMPDVHLMVYKNLIIYEHSNETAFLITINIDNVEEQVLDKRLNKLKETLYNKEAFVSPLESMPINFTSNMTEKTFKEKVQMAKQYIHNGEAHQIVISKRMQAELTGDPFSYYRKLRFANPSPYMFYVDFEDYLIVGASPESLIQTTGDHIVTNPIAGTRQRGTSDEEDQLLMNELLKDKKEVAEHQMLVDLSWNDLRKVCEVNSISIPTYMQIEKYQHVMHIVSEVHGKLKANKCSIDALIATLPAGTVSGLPKTRAMQIINELEDEKRGFYGGGIGYISFNHDLNIALAIRSIIIKNKMAYLQTGAGIVADSDPDKEFEETLHKARSLMEISEVDFTH